MFDLPNLPSRVSLIEAAEAGGLRITPPLKPYLEEKLWFGLFWSKSLAEILATRIAGESLVKAEILDSPNLDHRSCPRAASCRDSRAGNSGLARVEKIQSKTTGIRLESERIFGIGMG